MNRYRLIPDDKRHRRAWLRFFLPRRRISSAPRRIANSDTAHRADAEETLVILAGMARDAKDARALMDKYGVSSWHDLKPLLPGVRRHNIRRRFVLLWRRAFGHDYRDPWQRRQERIPVKTTWRRK